MSDTFTFEELSGAPSTNKGQTLSFDELSSKKPKPPENLRQSFMRSSAGRAVQNVADVLDLPLGLAGAAADVIGQTAGRIGAASAGATRKQAAKAGVKAGKEFAEPLSAPVNKLMGALGLRTGVEGGDESSVHHALNVFSSWIGKGSKWVEKHTGGLILKEDAQLLAEALMTGGAGKVVEKVLKSGKAAPMESPVVETLPELQTPKQNAQQTINESLRIKDPLEIKAYNQKRRQQVRAAFKKDPEYADYLKNVAEERAKASTSLDREIAEKSKVLSPKPVDNVSWVEISKILDKPGFERSATDLVKLRTFNKQSGQVDPKLLARMAAVGVGIASGVYLDPQNKLEGGILGALGGAVATRVHPTAVARSLKELVKPDPRIRITADADAHEYAIRKAGIETWKLQRDVEQLVPELARREAITTAIERRSTEGLSDKEIQVYNTAKKFFESFKQAGFSAGVLKTARDNYVTHLWQFGTQTSGAIEALLAKRSVSMSAKSRFARERTIDTIAEGEELGLKPLTKDISAIMGIYGNSMARSIANARFIKSLKRTTVENDSRLLMPAGRAPHGYELLNHPALAGLRVHPDIAASLKVLFDTHEPGSAMKVIEAINTGVKRTSVSFSLFHAKSIIEAATLASSNPFKMLGKVKGMLTGQDLYLKQLREQGVGPMIDKALTGGLKFSLDEPAVGELGGSFYDALTSAQAVLDQTIPHMGLPVKLAIKINHAVDNLMWGRLHASSALNLFAEKYETTLKNNAKAHQVDPSIRLLTDQEASRIAASFANDMIGGINWRRIAEGVKTRWGRDIALSLVTPHARRLTNLAVFSPDWAVATTRALTGAFSKWGEGGGLKGLVSARTLPDLHRQYLLRAATYYLIIGDGINYALSGHHIWDNKDPTRIDLGDGRTMQLMKHTTEPVHLLMNPGKYAINKLAYLPKQAAEQALGAEYLTTTGHLPPMKESRLAHLAKGISPISVQQSFDSSASSGIAGFLGAPVYGKTYAEQETKKYERRRKRYYGEKP